MDFTVSGSMRSATAVYPERSAKRTVAVRRSSGGASAALGGSSPARAPGGIRSGRDAAAGVSAAGAAAAGSAGAERGAPPSLQNFAPGGASAPQLGQRGASAVPHDMQKRARSGFSVPQLGQLSAGTWRTIRGA